MLWLLAGREAAAASLIRPFDDAVAAAAVLVFVGWSEGTGLGSSRSGMVEPISGSGQVRLVALPLVFRQTLQRRVD